MKKTFTMPTRITAVIIGIIVCCCCLLQSAIVNAQNPKEIKLTISFKNETLSGALMKLEVASKHPFSYDKNALSQVKVADVSFNQETLDKILDKLLVGTGQFYEVLNKNIVIAKQPSKSPNVQAGQGPGTIKGRIVEFETSQPLPGASVYIVELQKGMQSNNDGYYKFSNVPAGKYTLKVTFISYKTESVQIEVKAGKEETYDVKMQGSNSLNEVVVSSVRKSRAPVAHSTERQVLEEVKQASSVVSAISSEQITKSADRNAAEVMQRISGVTTVDDKFVVVRGLNQRYNLTYLNDNVAPSTETYSRAFALDLIPSRIIDKILVFKSPSPENQGDATGGVVKIYTKDAKNVKHFDIEFQGGYRTGTTFKNNFLAHQGGKWDFLGFDDGLRKLPSSVPGYGNLEKANLSQAEFVRSFSPNLTYGLKTALPNMQLTGNYYNSFKVLGKSLASLTSLSYKNERQYADVYRQQGIGIDALSIDQIQFDKRGTETAQLNLLQNFTFNLRDSSVIQFKNFLFQQGVSNTIERISRLNLDEGVGSQNKDIILSYAQRFLYAGNLGGTHYYNHGKHKLQWNGGYTYSQQETPDQRVIRLTAPTELLSTGDPLMLWRARGRNPQPDGSDETPIRMGIISRVWSKMNEGVYTGSVDYSFRYQPWLTFKAGAFQLWKERKLYRRIFTINEGDTRGTFSDYSTPVGGYGQYVDHNLVRFHEQDLSSVWSEDYFRADGSGLKVIDRTSATDAYVGTEQNNSGYVAFSFTPQNRKLELYGGLRFEYNRQRIGAAVPPLISTSPTAINRPILIDNPTTHWLPSLNASYRPSDNWVVRAAYGKTVNRFEFREASPYSELDYENNQYIAGNPNLQTASAHNYDLRIEFYPQNNSKGETISAGVFYKDITNPIERLNTASRVNASLPLPSIGFANAGSATVKGVEIELRKSLDFIPANFFKNLSLIANASFIKSEAVRDSADLQKLYERTGMNYVLNSYKFKRPLQGQAPYIINAGLYYDNAGSGTKISAIYNIVGTRLYAASGEGYRFNSYANTHEYRGGVFELPRHTLDFSISQRLLKSLQLKVSAQNLLGQEVRLAEDYNFTDKYEKLMEVTQPDGTVKKEGDNIFSSFNPGRYIFFTFSYSL